MSEQEYYIRAELIRRVRNVSSEITVMRQRLAEAVSERERLRRHLRELDKQHKGTS